MIERAQVIGAGRVGSAMAARLRERGLELDGDDAAARAPLRARPRDRRGGGRVEPGPWVAHVSGATPLAALEPHERRFGLHPLQTFTRARGPEQLDGAYAAVTRETDEAREVGLWLARTLGLEPFPLADAKRPSTTRAPRSPRTTSSRSGGPPARCSRPPARRRRRSTR